MSAHASRLVVSAALLAGAVMASACPASWTGEERDVTKSANRFAIAKDFFVKKQLEAAEAECGKAIAFNKANDEAYLLRGLISMTRAVDSQRLLEIDACLTGIDAEAMQKDLDHHLRKADDDFARAASVSPDYGEAWSDRGVVHNLLSDHEGAAEYLRRALENPVRLENPALTRAHLGWAYFHLGDHVQAVKELRQALQFQPNMCVATYRLARVYFAREEWEKAAELLQAVSEQAACGPQEADLYLMKTRMQQGLMDDARRARDACLSMSPSSCIAAQCRAELKGPVAAPVPPSISSPARAAGEGN